LRTLLGGVCNSARSIIENLKYLNLYYAIYAAHSNNFIPVTINGNEFNNNFRSITLKNINNATVTENDLKFNTFFA